jgi:ribosome-associated translation inhibitor RaiA
MTTHIDVRSSFDHSDALNKHIEERVLAALHPFADYVEDVALRLFDANGPRRGANDKVVRVSASVRPGKRVTVTAASSDLYRSVDRAVARLTEALRRHHSRLTERPARP